MKQGDIQEFVCEYPFVIFVTYSICQQPETHSDVLVRCYSCGITVHRFCYGICDAKSPWLCYACTANQKYPVCALCKRVVTCEVLSFQENFGSVYLERCWKVVTCSLCRVIAKCPFCEE